MSINILQINKLYHPWIGGVENHVQALAENLLDYEEINVEVVVSNENSRLKQETINGVKVTKLPNFIYSLFKKPLLFSMPISLSLPKFLRKKVDILHFHLPNPWGVLSYFMARPKGKVIITWHSDIIKQKFFLFFYKPFLKMFLKKASLIIVTSPNMIVHSKYLKGFANKCQVVPLGIDTNKLELTSSLKEEISQIKSKQDKKNLLFVGRLVYYKGVEYLVKAMTTVDANLTIIGEGNLKKDLESMIEKNNLQDKIKIIPPVSDKELVRQYHLCDIFVLPSIAITEAFGIVQLEAMVCGKPVISTNLPTGVPFVNQDGKTGLVVEPKDFKSLAAAINKLLKDDIFSKDLGNYAQKRVKNEFTNKAVASKIVNIYKNILND